MGQFCGKGGKGGKGEEFDDVAFDDVAPVEHHEQNHRASASPARPPSAPESTAPTRPLLSTPDRSQSYASTSSAVRDDASPERANGALDIPPGEFRILKAGWLFKPVRFPHRTTFTCWDRTLMLSCDSY